MIDQRLDEIFPGHGISSDARTAQLSLAQRQMVEIAQATISKDDALRLLILDEPTSALSKQHADNLFAFLRGLRGQGVSTVLISHKMGEILANTDRTVVMRDGRVVSQQPTDGRRAEVVAQSIQVGPDGRQAAADELGRPPRVAAGRRLDDADQGSP